MRKIIKNIFIIALFSFVLTLSVDAATIEFEGKSNITIKQDSSETIKINIKTKNDENIEKVEFSLDYDNTLVTINSNSQDTYLQQAAKNGSSVLIQSSGKFITNGEIFSFVVKNDINEDKEAIIKIKDLKINDEAMTDEVKPLTISLKKTVTTTTRKANTSAKLTDFSVSNATVKPAFSQDIKEYKIYTNKDTIRQVSIIPKYEESGVQLDSECTLGCTAEANKLTLITGKNEATFTFTSEDGKSTEIYKFIIYRGPTTDGSNLLSDLSIEGLALNEKFDKSNLDYTVTVPYETESLIINAVPEDENADIKIKGNENLTVGENVITVTVTSSETTEKKIYNIIATREEFKPIEENQTVVAPKIEKKKNNNLWKILIIIFISLLIIGLAAYFIFFKKNDKKKKKDKKDHIEVKEKDKILKNPIIDDDKEPTSVEEALADLMKTKETELK